VLNSLLLSDRQKTGAGRLTPLSASVNVPPSNSLANQEVTGESFNQIAQSPGRAGNRWFDIYCRSVPPNDVIVAGGLAMATESARVRANDPRRLCNSWSLSPPRVA